MATGGRRSRWRTAMSCGWSEVRPDCFTTTPCQSRRTMAKNGKILLPSSLRIIQAWRSLADKWSTTLRLVQTSRWEFAVDCGVAGDRKFPISLPKRNHPSQVAADLQCSVDQPKVDVLVNTTSHCSSLFSLDRWILHTVTMQFGACKWRISYNLGVLFAFYNNNKILTQLIDSKIHGKGVWSFAKLTRAI